MTINFDFCYNEITFHILRDGSALVADVHVLVLIVSRGMHIGDRGCYCDTC